MVTPFTDPNSELCCLLPIPIFLVITAEKGMFYLQEITGNGAAA